MRSRAEIAIGIAVITGMALFVIGVVKSCTYEDMTGQLDDMRADLRDIGAAAGTAALGPLDVMAKREASYVAARYAARGGASQRDSIVGAALARGYREPQTSDGATWLCSNRSKYRTLVIGPIQDGVVNVTIHASHPPLFGQPRCWTQSK
jgi:hypothetical protein